MQKDKLYHFVVCAALSVAHPALAVVAGIGKELYDKYIKITKFDWHDIFADAAGTLVGSCVYLIIN